MKYKDVRGDLDESEFLRLARERFDAAITHDQENRAEALEDLQFKAGEQWSQATLNERADEKNPRPCLTVNKMPQFVRQVTGDIRINRPAIKVRPVDDVSDPEVAELFTGLIRHIEQASKARVAYNTAADNAASCGIGHFRILTEYTTDDVFDQDIRIKRMPNAMSVVWDPHSVEITREDAEWCFVYDDVDKEVFTETWPDANMAGFDAMDAVDTVSEWTKDETVRVAEYWVKVPTKKTICLMADGAVIEKDKDTPADQIVKERKVIVPVVYQYILSGVEVLEGPNEWAGKHIPIVPVMGEEIFIGDRCVRHGVIRFAKDPQRLYNYARSAAAESISLAPKAPFIGTAAMFKGQEELWAQANTKNVAYLPYNADKNAPTLRPERQMPPQISTALVNEVNTASDEMKSVTGIYDASLGARSNETSGRAIRARQMEGDVGSYVYMDNLSIAIGYAGEILIDMIPRIYDTERVVRLLNEDDSEAMARINAVVGVDPQTGKEIIKNNLAVGRYDVVVQTGPSYSTKRQESAEAMISFVQAVPQAGGLIGDLIAKNQDWPGAEQIAERLKKLLPPGMDEDAPPAPPPPPDPKMLESQAKIEKIAAETEGQKLDNMTKEVELAQMTGAITQAVTQSVQAALMEVIGAMQSQMPPGLPQNLPQQAPGQEPGFLMPDSGGYSPV